jgi:hypothetical protein
VQSIKIYAEPDVFRYPGYSPYDHDASLDGGAVADEADSDVYQLLADVEREITGLAAGGGGAGYLEEKEATAKGGRLV